jgi:glycolate dehydrogenase iron-sulfur subunit
LAEPTILPPGPKPDLATADGRAHYSRSLDCVHCGLCLPVCPTYRLSGRETSSPRGRIYLIRAEADGRLRPGAAYEEELHYCLVCRACETVCPSGVEFEALMEHARADAKKKTPRPGFPGALERFLLRRVAPSRRALRLAADLLALYSKTPLGAMARKLGIAGWLLRGAREREALLPAVPKRSRRRDLAPFFPARGALRGRVAIQEGCVASQLFPDVNEAAVRVLTKNGFEVVLWKEPSCCGALHAHAGDLDFARTLAKKNIEAFERSGARWLVQTSAGCGAHCKSTARLFEAEPAWQARGAAFAAATRDVCEFLVEQGYAPRRGPVDAKIAYDEPCHLVHGQRVSAQPKAILHSIPGAILVPLAGASDCCGAAGTYSIERTQDSLAILDAKMAAIRESGCDVVATGNPGCILQLRTGARRAGLSIRVLHPIQLLDEE